jgi:hypothetical protein
VESFTAWKIFATAAPLTPHVLQGGELSLCQRSDNRAFRGIDLAVKVDHTNRAKEGQMITRRYITVLATLARPWNGAFAALLLWSVPIFASDTINGRVLAAGAQVVGSTVTLWAESAGAPSQLAQTQTDANTQFVLSADGKEANLYLVAKAGSPAANGASGNNSALALMTVLGSKAPANVVVNEMTTVASVWTHLQFLDGTTIKGPALASRSPPETCRALSIFKQVVGARGSPGKRGTASLTGVSLPHPCEGRSCGPTRTALDQNRPLRGEMRPVGSCVGVDSRGQGAACAGVLAATTSRLT